MIRALYAPKFWVVFFRAGLGLALGCCMLLWQTLYQQQHSFQHQAMLFKDLQRCAQPGRLASLFRSEDPDFSLNSLMKVYRCQDAYNVHEAVNPGETALTRRATQLCIKQDTLDSVSTQCYQRNLSDTNPKVSPAYH